ncbi:P-loop containing nucleoside triphosphate hydrolase protein [Cadophora sp. DSE1049]|nr:P-loop containing nucleoside triphosphate hydrolase protein [Cadophora sp. DSE1049]
MREESNRPGSEHAVMISANHLAGKLNPKELSIPLLSKNIQAASRTGIRRFVLDGFPRDLEQSDYFEVHVNSLSLVILLECPEQVYVERILGRARFDDNSESMKGRLDTYNKSTSEVVSAFEQSGMLERVRGDMDTDEVHRSISSILLKRGLIKT